MERPIARAPQFSSFSPNALPQIAKNIPYDITDWLSDDPHAQATELFPHLWGLSWWKVALTSRRLRVTFCLS
jgi:hypothetical protein